MKRRGKIALVIAGGPFSPPVMDRDHPEAPSPAEAVTALFPSLQDSTIEVVDWSRQPSSHYTIRMTMDLIELCRKLIQDGVEGIVVYAGTDMLEPVMRLEILTPEDAFGELSNEVIRRGGMILDAAVVSRFKRVTGKVPLAQMFGFSKTFPTLTGGRGSFSMEPCGFQPVDGGGA